jgi:FkbM family methyltransferase
MSGGHSRARAGATHPRWCVVGNSGRSDRPVGRADAHSPGGDGDDVLTRGDDATMLRPVSINRTYVLRSGLAKGLKKRGGLGIRQVLRLRDDLDPEDAFLQSLDFAEQTIFDIGGNLGIHTIFFASRAGRDGRVVTFEPDPVSYQDILANLAVNGLRNVLVRNVGVAKHPGQLDFAYPADRGRGSADPESLKRRSADPGVQLLTLPVTSIDAELRSGEAPIPDFVKIDVEGLELAVLEGMADTVRQAKPAVFVEIHGHGLAAKEANSRRVVQWLHDRAYKLQHVESGQAITPENSEMAREGHLYCV